MNVFIVGVAGATGSRVARLLADRGDVVSGLYRRPEQRATLIKYGIAGVLGDISNMSEAELASAASGAEVVVFAAGAGAEDSDSMIDAVDGDGVSKAIEAARLANISRLLLVSVFPEAWRERQMPKSFEHYIEVKKRADVCLARSPLDWIILRPSVLTDDPGQGLVSLGPAEHHTQIPRDDVAETIAVLLHTPEVRRSLLEVTAGGTAISEAVAALVSR